MRDFLPITQSPPYEVPLELKDADGSVIEGLKSGPFVGKLIHLGEGGFIEREIVEWRIMEKDNV